MAYISKRQKIKEHIQRSIVNELMKRPLLINYNQIIDMISLDTNASKNMVKEIICSFISIDILKHVGNDLTLSDRLMEEYERNELVKERWKDEY